MDKAQQARTENDKGAMKDSASLLATNYIQEYYDRVYVQNDGTFKTNYPTAGAYAKYKFPTATEGGYTYAVSGDILTVTNPATGNTVSGTILDNGNIEWNNTNTSNNNNDNNNQGTDIKFKLCNEEIDVSKLNETTVKEYYGTTVAIIDGVEYGLFYVDYAGKFGEEGTIYLSIDEVNIMKNLNPDWDYVRGDTEFDNMTTAEKVTVALCNPEETTLSTIKTGFENKYGADNINYVIPAPSVELYFASYNSKYNTNYSIKYHEIEENGYTKQGYWFTGSAGVVDDSSHYKELNYWFYTDNLEMLCSPDLFDEKNVLALNAGTLDHSGTFFEDVEDVNDIDDDACMQISPLISLKPGVKFEKDITLTKDNVSDYYGITVNKINDIEYALFYIDFDGDFGDENTIYLKANTNLGQSKLNTLLSNDDDITTAINIAKQINPDWSNILENCEYSELSNREKGAVYLCNPNNSFWAGEDHGVVKQFEQEYGEGNINYIIGAPSGEIFAKSINQAGNLEEENIVDARWFPDKVTNDLTTSKYKYSGYLYSITGRDTTSNSNYGYSTLSDEQKNKLSLEQQKMYKSFIIASPMSGTNVSYVSSIGSNFKFTTYSWSSSATIKPFVSIKPGVELTAIN